MFSYVKISCSRRGASWQRGSIRASHPAAPGLLLGIILDVAEIYQWCCSEEIRQWLNFVAQTHLVQASHTQNN